MLLITSFNSGACSKDGYHDEHTALLDYSQKSASQGAVLATAVVVVSGNM